MIQNNYDKSTWGDGPWQQEPDFEEFKYKGLDCFLRRYNHGCWNGYVLLPLDSKYNRGEDTEKYQDLKVHGGITYAHNVYDMVASKKYLALGFDCAHYNDARPNIEDFNTTQLGFIIDEFLAAIEGINDHSKTYRTIDYARSELKKLVEQLIE